MNSECILPKEQIREINKKCGGDLRSDAVIETALMMGKGRSVFKKIANLWRAMLVGHPFTDGNKRTALVVALTIMEKFNIETDDEIKESIVSDIMKIASENITDISRIERMIRYAAKKR